ncbi:hypothetical protein BY996DRAFT_6461692 [Phakopsora pachyrhizi]|nr:hypothetical protein BY996DRAFT_6461692 [Phakopsora pachyrhizi]
MPALPLFDMLEVIWRQDAPGEIGARPEEPKDRERDRDNQPRGVGHQSWVTEESRSSLPGKLQVDARAVPVKKASNSAGIELADPKICRGSSQRRPPASKKNRYALMAAEFNQKSKSGLNISSKQIKERFKTYKAKYVRAKKMSDSIGFGVSEDDQSKGIITISQKLNNICPCFEQMDVIFGSQPNITHPSVADTCKNSIETVTMVDEHIDEVRNLANLGESPFENAGYSQNNTFEEREEGIENIPHDSDNASNSLNLNPESHKQGPKSTLASSYAELYKSKVTKLNWEQQKWHLEKEQKDKEQHMELTIREKEIQFAKDGKDKELEVRILIANKDCEAMKLKEDNAMLLAVVGSSRSIEEITEISKIMF